MTRGELFFQANNSQTPCMISINFQIKNSFPNSFQKSSTNPPIKTPNLFTKKISHTQAAVFSHPKYSLSLLGSFLILSKIFCLFLLIVCLDKVTKFFPKIQTG